MFIRSTLALLIAGFLVLLGIVALTYRLSERAQVYFDDAIEARDARNAAVELRNAVQTAESSQRGFLFTGNEIYLAPYGTSKALAQRQLNDLRRILAPYEEARASLERLTLIIAEKLEEMDQTIALKRDRRDDDALALIRTNRGKSLMDEANIFFSGLIRAADSRLTTGVSEQRSNARWLRWVTIVGGIVIVVVVGSAAFAVFRYTQDLAAARDEVRALNMGLEERVKDRTADLAHANEEIQRFAYIVTHDLRAPLVNIMGFTSEIEGSVKSLHALIDRAGDKLDVADPVIREARMAVTEDLPEAIGFIRSSTTKMDDLIKAILKLSREGQRALRPEPLKLAAIVETSVAAMQHQLSEAGAKINLKIHVPLIVSDRLSLEQLFGNLLDNAVKYRAKNRPLEIDVTGASAPGDRIVIEIADSGRGIAEQDLERVFEMFRRSGVQDQSGEGIGLAYVRTVVRKLGGEITVTSNLDQGTTFRVELPRALQGPGNLAA